MKLLVTGANGYIGSYISQRLKEDFESSLVIDASRQILDLSSRKSVVNFFIQHETFDAVIHCTSKGGRRLISDNSDVLYDNIYAFENIANEQEKIGKLITFGSGAEFFGLEQKHYYALAKKIISDRIVQIPNACNLRVFSCFGGNEEAQRFIRKSILSAISNKPIEIIQDRFMGFIYIEDLYRVVKHYIKSKISLLPKDVDVNYDPQTLMEIVEKIKKISGSASNIIVEKDGYDFPYYGGNGVLQSLQLDLIGFEKSLIAEVKKLKDMK
jgi:GDP-L-fucose synthase